MVLVRRAFLKTAAKKFSTRKIMWHVTILNAFLHANEGKLAMNYFSPRVPLNSNRSQTSKAFSFVSFLGFYS